MRVSSLEVHRFRSIKDLKLKFGDLTLLIGPNSSGKSTILEAFTLPIKESLNIEDTLEIKGESVTVEIDLLLNNDDIRALETKILKKYGERVEISREYKVRVRFELTTDRNVQMRRVEPLDEKTITIIESLMTKMYFVPENRMIGRIGFEEALKALAGFTIDFGKVGDINRALSRATNYSDVRLRIDRNEIAMELYDKGLGLWVPFENVGGGVKALLLPLLALTASNDVVIIDDFDLGMHTSLQLKSFNAVMEAVSRGVQVILSTHSPLILLSALKAHKTGSIKDLRVYLIYKREYTKAFLLPTEPPFGLPKDVEEALEEVGARGIFAEGTDLIFDLASVPHEVKLQ